MFFFCLIFKILCLLRVYTIPIISVLSCIIFCVIVTLSARLGTVVPSWRLTTHGRSRIEVTTAFVIIRRARRSTNTSLHRWRVRVPGFSCTIVSGTNCRHTSHRRRRYTSSKAIWRQSSSPGVSQPPRHNYMNYILSPLHQRYTSLTFYMFRGLVTNLVLCHVNHIRLWR